jgi:hypothetical protein
VHWLKGKITHPTIYTSITCRSVATRLSSRLTPFVAQEEKEARTFTQPDLSTLFKAVLKSLRKYQTTNATTNGHANPLTKLTIAVMNDAFHSGLGA